MQRPKQINPPLLLTSLWSEAHSNVK